MEEIQKWLQTLLELKLNFIRFVVSREVLENVIADIHCLKDRITD